MTLGTWIQVLLSISLIESLVSHSSYIFVGYGSSILVLSCGDYSLSNSSHTCQFRMLFMLLTSSTILSLCNCIPITCWIWYLWFFYEGSQLFVKDLNSDKTIRRCPILGPPYAMTHILPSSSNVCLTTLSYSIWHNRLGHHGQDVFCNLNYGVLFHVIRSIPPHSSILFN